jgi:hypothetical protein
MSVISKSSASFLGTSFKRRKGVIPPCKGGDSKAELVELFETGDFEIEKTAWPCI